MYRGKVEDEWGRTSSAMALFANANRDPKKRSKPYTPDDFNPTSVRPRQSRGTRLTSKNIDILKVLVHNGSSV